MTFSRTYMFHFLSPLFFDVLRISFSLSTLLLDIFTYFTYTLFKYTKFCTFASAVSVVGWNAIVKYFEIHDYDIIWNGVNEYIHDHDIYSQTAVSVVGLIVKSNILTRLRYFYHQVCFWLWIRLFMNFFTPFHEMP